MILLKIEGLNNYPIYGDDSTVRRDVDTSGRLYVRLDWDKSSALWGNVKTEFNGATDIASYDRGLYGAKLYYQRAKTTELGESTSQLKVFAAEQQTAPGRTELLGTGGSLYFMKHTDVVPSSEKVTLEVRDIDSGRVTSTYTLLPGRDYEMDSFQGRLVLSRPLLQIRRDNSPLQDQPLDGSSNVLVVSYEYYPSSLDNDNISVGVNGKQWIGEHVAVGGTYVNEERAGNDYNLQGVDLTLQKGKGTWIKFEHAKSESGLAPLHYSTDGGLTFASQTLDKEGQTDLVDGQSSRVEARLNTHELGWTDRSWRTSAWHMQKDAGFSSEHTTALGKDVKDSGVELLGELSADVNLLAGHKRLVTEGGDSINELNRTQLGLSWRMPQDWTLTGEVQQVEQKITNEEDAKAGLIGLRVNKRIQNRWDLYAAAQASFSQTNYEDNNSFTLGTKYAFENDSSLGLEVTDGDRGSAVTAFGEYKRTNDHSIYTSYTHSPSTNAPTSSDSLIASKTFSKHTGWTLGQRLQLGQQWRLTNEAQWSDSEQSRSRINSLGLDFTPSVGWNVGLSVQKGDVQEWESNQTVDRQAVSLAAGYTNNAINWSSKLEHRLDKTTATQDRITGEETASITSNGDQTQWLSTNRIHYKINDDWRMMGKFNYSKTERDNLVDAKSDVTEARLIDSSLGLAWRPVNGRVSVLSKLGYFYDLAPAGQSNTVGSNFDQRSIIASIEGVYEINPNWDLAGKLAKRRTSTRLERGQGNWFSNNANYGAAQVRWHVGGRGTDDEGKAKDLFQGWSVMGEYRVLEVEQDGTKKGALVSVDKELGKNLRFGVGYNFTDFSADLTQLSYKHKGWFANLMMRY